jgi:hypothetical protein
VAWLPGADATHWRGGYLWAEPVGGNDVRLHGDIYMRDFWPQAESCIGACGPAAARSTPAPGLAWMAGLLLLAFRSRRA